MTTTDRHRTATLDIQDLLIRYATAIDRRDWELFRACFVDDVRTEYDGIGTWSGVDEITSFMEEVHADMGHTVHRITNMAVEVDGDGDTATARSYVDVVLMTGDGAAGAHAVGFYDDQIRRIADGWRIAERRYTAVHQESIDAG